MLASLLIKRNFVKKIHVDDEICNRHALLVFFEVKECGLTVLFKIGHGRNGNIGGNQPQILINIQQFLVITMLVSLQY